MSHAVKESTVKNPSTIGLDLAKNIMHLHALDEQGNTLWKKTLKTDDLVIFLNKLEPCLIGIEVAAPSYLGAATLQLVDPLDQVEQLRKLGGQATKSNDESTPDPFWKVA
jgi:hypothetical protein